ncbi:unnamed protein product [Adineta ricciae]|uniref:DUF4614 domain-containing protein n=1 Tax=Adineta ricciae TaxID=249248 RepID=A0A813R2X9_ADIRI|nr:unnamed protein product [Adineta ricciae]CAF0896544.1 unnamed protein product [Adineta ricciae]
MATLSELTARVAQRKQRLEEEQQRFDRKLHIHAQNHDGISEPSELESSRQAPPKPKRRHHRSTNNKSAFDDDSSLHFNYSEKQSDSTATTTSTNTPREANRFVKKSSNVPVLTEKISVTRSPRDVSSPRVLTKQSASKTLQAPTAVASSGLLGQSSLLARATRRTQLYTQGIELEPGTFDQGLDEDESSSDATSTSTSKKLAAGRKTFLKKPVNNAPHGEVPELLHLDSETNNSEQEKKKSKHRKNSRTPSVHDTEDDSSIDFLGDGSSSEGRKTPTLTPRKGILKSPKDYPKENEHFVQFSKKLVTVQSDDERAPTPTRTSRSTTPRRVQIAKPPSPIDDAIPSETESISTAIDIANENDYSIPFSDHVSESVADNMFANLVMNDEPLITPAVATKSPRRTSPMGATKKPSTTPVKHHPSHRTLSDVSDEDNTRTDDIPEEIGADIYSEDFSSAIHTETSTPRAPTPTKVRIEKPTQSDPNKSTRKATTENQEVQVDLTSAPFQSSLNQVHSIYLINQNDLNEARPSTLIRSVIEPNVLQSLLTTNPVLLAVDDLIREQSSLLRSFIQLQRTYYESTVRSIRPEHVYVTKDNSLRYIAEQQQSRMYLQSNDDSMTN